MSIEILTRAALGSNVPLGTLYDSRTDQFLQGISIINREIPESAKEIIDATHSDVQYIYSDRVSEKFSRLSVNCDLQISLLLGLVTLAGSGEFIGFPKTSAASTRVSLIYKVRTKNEVLKIFHPDLKSEFNFDALRISSSSTHFVSQIQWGANSILTCEYHNTHDENDNDVNEKIAELMNYAGRAIKRSTEVVSPPGGIGNNTCHKFLLFGDVFPEQDISDMQAAIHLFRQVPSFINATDSGWGIPVSYTLLPISILKDKLKDTTEITPVVNQISTATVIRVVRFFETLEDARQLLSDLHVTVQRFHYGLQPAEVSQVFKYKDDVDVHVASLKSNLSDIIQGVRLSRQGPEEVEEFLVTLHNHEFSSINITEKILGWSNIKRKVDFCKKLIAKGIKYIKSDWGLEDMIQDNRSKKLFILYVQPHGTDLDMSNWWNNTKLFLKQNLTRRDQQAFVVVDCNLVQCPPMNVTTAIQVMERGVVTVKDLLEYQTRFEGLAVANLLVNPRRMFTTKLSNELFPYTTHCPGLSCNPGATYNWTCSRCGKTLLIGEDDSLYCDCGQSFLNSTSYKCSDPRHGDEFDQHDDTYIQNYLFLHHHSNKVSTGDCSRPAKLIQAISNDLLTTREPTVTPQPTNTPGPTTTTQPTTTKSPTTTPRPTTPPKLPTDCVDIFKFLGGDGTSGNYQIYLENDANIPVPVYCDMLTDGGGWTVFQRRMDATDFFRDWNEYTRGFGSNNGSHWLGLTTLAVLTKGNDTELRVDLEDWNGQKGFAVYKHFYVANETDNFRLDVSGYSGNIGDSLQLHNGMAFSTKDKDNDKWRWGNCAQTRHGAWWYKHCFDSNLNGLYTTSAEVGNKYVTWWHWKREVSLKWTEMKIRKLSFKPTN